MRQPIKYLAILLVFIAGCSHPAGARDANEENNKFRGARPALDKGIFLIAKRGLNDPNFHQSVILITEFNETGTMGLIINRPIAIPADKLFPGITRLTPDSGNVFVGGPVAVNSIQLLVQSPESVQGSAQIIDDLYLVNSAKGFNQLLRENTVNQKVRVFAGYAGWAAGQLETELLRGDWYLWQADPASVFTGKPDRLWEELIRLASEQWVQYVPAFNWDSKNP